jgi:hypothetical protein
VLPTSRKKKKKKDQFAIKTDRRQTEKNEEIHAQINRTNLFFAGRAVSLPTHEQKLVSLALN